MANSKIMQEEWERLLAAERHLQSLVPESVLVGGTAAALDGVLTGIRQLRRLRPLETETIAGLRIPTLGEMARIKAWLLATRYTVRDYLDLVVLLERLGRESLGDAFREFDAIYAQENASSPLAEVADRLTAADPKDRTKVKLNQYKGIRPPWNDWNHLEARGRFWAQQFVAIALEEDKNAT